MVDLFTKCPRCGYESPAPSMEELMHEVKRGDEVLAFSTMSENLTLMITIRPVMFELLLGKDREAYENDILGLIRAELYKRPGSK